MSEEIYKWIDGYQLSRQKKNISRDFSDAVPLAEILKMHFPKLVDLHNYTPKNSVSQKLINWSTLQRKVLSKLRMNLSKGTMEELARAEPGAVEKVLSQVKYIIERYQREKEEDEESVYVIEGIDDAGSGNVLPIKMKQGSKVSDQKIVPADIFNDMLKSLDEKEQIVNELRLKLDHWEKLVSIKDQRIADLEGEIKRLTIEKRISSNSEYF
ncbi:PREDICTED: sperm flagellar protein 1-like [Nicrophorus vespilloides]|uniref:Sperm flagellar protein 1-like n=1 Tax=Nicrophorus vespilloides TaxID=110193 RepID=A0ABM1M4N1_NICVS|nr:PREDICTED: sperm flagellar protein 1-like [Nicrophorus vespilloides]